MFFKTNFEVFGNQMKHSSMFDIASQTINSSWRNSKQKFIKFCDNQDHLLDVRQAGVVSFVFSS